MNPVSFPEQVCVIAKDQPEYLPLPAWIGDDGEVISCWRLGWRERVRLLLTGRLWLRQLAFFHPLQPILPQTEYPFIKGEQT